MDEFKTPLARNLNRNRVQLNPKNAASREDKWKQSSLNIQTTTVRHRVKASEKEKANLELDLINQESAKMESGRAQLRSTNRANKILVGSPYMVR